MNRLKKNCDTHIYVCVCYSAMKKDEILPFATTWMDMEGIMIREISHTEKDNTV